MLALPRALPAHALEVAQGQKSWKLLQTRTALRSSDPTAQLTLKLPPAPTCPGKEGSLRSHVPKFVILRVTGAARASTAWDNPLQPCKVLLGFLTCL